MAPENCAKPPPRPPENSTKPPPRPKLYNVLLSLPAEVPSVWSAKGPVPLDVVVPAFLIQSKSSWPLTLLYPHMALVSKSQASLV